MTIKILENVFTKKKKDNLGPYYNLKQHEDIYSEVIIGFKTLLLCNISKIYFHHFPFHLSLMIAYKLKKYIYIKLFF